MANKEQKTKAKQIFNEAVKSILSHIRYETILFHQAMGFEQPVGDDCFVAYAADISKSPIMIDVEVYHFDSDNTRTIERWELSEIRVTTLGQVYFIAGDNDEELNSDDISFEQLVNVADLLEKAYIKKVSK